MEVRIENFFVFIFITIMACIPIIGFFIGWQFGYDKRTTDIANKCREKGIDIDEILFPPF